ncbi:hypothetical protein EYF80_013558 [Liparis tanakae]|uniref:Uncharacterized protein n=1 Tax=Liparis tanakae TaxID=230148 RepID=A0A4Z2IEG0_9TELE|nr:hypothetical protein EYF80_013558 [Liparis tanakae]
MERTGFGATAEGEQYWLAWWLDGGRGGPLLPGSGVDVISHFGGMTVCLGGRGSRRVSRKASGGRVPGERGLPVGFRRSTPPAVLRRGLLQPRPLLPVLRVESAPTSDLLHHLAVILALPDHVRLPFTLDVCTPVPLEPGAPRRSPSEGDHALRSSGWASQAGFILKSDSEGSFP